jgi:hypothetical protein
LDKLIHPLPRQLIGFNPETSAALLLINRATIVVINDRYSENMTQAPQELDWQLRAKRKASIWSQLFAVIGAVLAAIYSILISQYGSSITVLDPLVLPASFILFLGDWRGGFGPAVLLAMAANSAVWAGIGWIFGYGTSR